MCIRDRYERIKDLPIVQLIQINRLRWAGRVQRMADDRIPKRVMNYLPMGRRRKGRPRTRWLDQVGKEAVRPVSYTHLDVYKRQPWLHTAKQPGYEVFYH